MFLPYGRQWIEDDDVAAVAKVLTGEFLTTGPAVASFEAAFASKVGAPYAASCSSGTAGLHLAMLALGIGAGDVVISPAITFVATANAARYVGADVVFADCDPETGLMRPQDLSDALRRVPANRRARCVNVVHMCGQPADMGAIADLARKHGLYIVEDACHAIGARFGDHLVGACHVSDMAVFSLHPVKLIAMGEGGVVTTRDPELHRRLKLLSSHGLVRDPAHFEDAAGFDASGSPNPWYYEMPEIGFNYRAPDILCALGESQLKKTERFLERRETLARRYDRALSPLSALIRPLERLAGRSSGWHLYAVLIDFQRLELSRAQLMARLRDDYGVGTQVHYIPVNRQPYYRSLYGYDPLPGAESYYARTLSLPLFPAMHDRDVDRVVDALKQCL